MNDKISELEKKLKVLHPDVLEIKFIDDEIEVYFLGYDYPSIPSGFKWGSPTRDILERMKDEFLKNEGV